MHIYLHTTLSIVRVAKVVLHPTSATSSIAHAEDSCHALGCVLDVRNVEASHVAFILRFLLLLEDPHTLLTALLLEDSVELQGFLNLTLLLATWTLRIVASVHFVSSTLVRDLMLHQLLVHLGFEAIGAEVAVVVRFFQVFVALWNYLIANS